MEHEKGYILQYDDKTKLGDVFGALSLIADQEQVAMMISYRASIIQFFNVQFGDGTHQESLEERLRSIPHVVSVEKDYLVKRIEDGE